MIDAIRRPTLRGLLICAGVLFALPGGARANCSGYINFGQQGLHCSGGTAPCFLTSPGFGVASSLHGTFWALGHGDPALGAGNDSGDWGLSFWLLDKPDGFKIKGHWNYPSIDGCIDGLVAEGLSNEVMVAALSDTGLFDDAGYFAVAAVERGQPADLNQFDFAVGIGENINLAQIPAPSVQSSFRIQGTQ